MYDLINAYIPVILETIELSHVRDYDWLIENMDQVQKPAYQRAYRYYWRMSAARLSAAYCTKYFQALDAALTNPPTLRGLTEELYLSPTHMNGRRSVQFSFATKLLHTANTESPLYDARIAAFYFFQGPSRQLQAPQKIAELVSFHLFLNEEYMRVLANGLLDKSINAFREKFNPQYFTDQKVIDSLIWGYVASLRSGHLQDGQIIYH